MFWGRTHWNDTAELFPAFWGMYLQPSDSTAAGESLGTLITFLFDLADSVHAADAPGLHAALALVEALTSSDAITKHPGPNLADGVGVLETALAFEAAKALADLVESSEQPAQDLSLFLASAAGAQDSPTLGIAKILVDALALAESESKDVAAFIAEALQASDVPVTELLIILTLAHRAFSLTARSRPRRADG
jgi:hypothetical protein